MSNAANYTTSRFRKAGDAWQRYDAAAKRWTTLHVDKTVVPYVWTWKT